jgi:hypothetical protein
MDIVNDIEEKFPVDQWIINDIHVWPLIRAQLVSQMDFFLNNKLAHRSRPGLTALRNIRRTFDITASFANFLYAFVSDRKCNDKIARRNIDALFLTHCINRVLVNKYYYNKMIDPIIDRLDEQQIRSIVLEITWNGQYYIPRYKSSKYIQPYLDYLLFKNKIPLIKKSFGNSQLSRFNDFVKYLDGLNLRLIIPDIRSIKKVVAIIRDIATFLKKIISQTNPVVGLSTQYYGWDGMALNLACREAGIISVDIQHGIQNDLHWAYGRWLRVPEKGYELLPELFWCWSDTEAKVIEKWNKKVKKYHRPIVVGNLWLNKWLSGDSDNVSSYDVKVSRIKQKHDKSIQILYTMQDEIIPPLILEAIRESSAFCFWWIRCHPTLIDKRSKFHRSLGNLGLDNFIVEEASTWPLYALLRHMAIHITGWSTTVIEASVFNVPSILIHEFGSDLFAEQIDKGMAFYAHNSQEVVDAIMTLGNDKTKKMERKEEEITVCKDIQFPFDLFEHNPN